MPVADFLWSPSNATSVPAAFDTGFASAAMGARFSFTHQTLGSTVTGQTSLAATTPTFLIAQTTAGTRLTLNRIELTQDGTVAGAKIDVIVAIDTANRFSSGGATHVPQNHSARSTVTSGATCYTNPTASAAGGGTRYLDGTNIAALVNTRTVLYYYDEAQIGTTGSILIYTSAATTGPTWKWRIVYTEERIPVNG
jgi:hypothetical protein